MGMASIGAIAAVSVALISGGGSKTDLPPSVPPVIKPPARDFGNENARLSLPPRGKWFGFSGTMFIHLGRNPSLDVGVTPEGTVRDSVAAGANSGRIEISWVDIEPDPGRYDQRALSLYDRYVSALEARGGRALLVLGGTPRWAAAHPDLPGSPPPDTAAGRATFAKYAAFVAQRWPNAVAIETWNEPNGRIAWAPKPNPAAYARLHRAAAKAIRQVNPKPKVLIGGLVAAARKSADFGRAQPFLKRMYAAGLKPSDYDGIAIHAYPNTGRLDQGEFVEGIEDVRLGYAWIDPDAALWFTETGVTTTGSFKASPKVQARQISRVLKKLLTAPRVEGVYLHTLYDAPYAPRTEPIRGYGLMGPRGASPGAPKPAYCALRLLAGARDCALT